MYNLSDIAQEAVKCLQANDKPGYSGYVTEMYALGLSKEEIDNYLILAGRDDVEIPHSSTATAEPGPSYLRHGGFGGSSFRHPVGDPSAA